MKKIKFPDFHFVKKPICEIVERSSGFWVVDGSDAEGPFDSVSKANDWVKRHTKRKKSSKVATVNVIELVDGEMMSVATIS